MWDEDVGNLVRPREFVDKFHYDYFNGADCKLSEVDIYGTEAPKSRYSYSFYCWIALIFFLYILRIEFRIKKVTV